jgi:hypothetical protein
MKQDKPNVWNFRHNLEDKMSEIAIQSGKQQTHLQNIYHQIKRIESHLDKQNGSIARHDNIISKWKGITIGVIVVLSAAQVLIAMMLH